MRKNTKILLTALAVAMALSLSFIIPSSSMLEEERFLLEDELWSDEEDAENSFDSESDTEPVNSSEPLDTIKLTDKSGSNGFLSLLIPSARAESIFVRALPIDFSPGRPLNPAGFTETGYKDPSIQVELEVNEGNGIKWWVAYIKLVHASQLRTATAASPRSSRVALISSMAEKNNAVIACNANYMANDPAKTSFEYRMGEKIRNKLNPVKDTLLIDQNGDFFIISGDGKQEQLNSFLDADRTIVNAFTFGPALVKDDELQAIPEKYSYNPHRPEPRLALGQIGPLEYVIVHAEGRSENSPGATIEQLAEYMFNIGCTQAFNFDGGNSATITFNGGYFQDRSINNERAQSDMIYFASLME